MTPRAFLEDLFNTAVAAAHPATCLPPHLPAPPANGRLILLAAGKAAGSMIEAAERHYLDDAEVSRRAPHRHRGRAPWLWAPDARGADGRSRTSDSGCGGA